MNKFEVMQEMRVRDESSRTLLRRKNYVTARFVSIIINLNWNTPFFIK